MPRIFLPLEENPHRVHISGEDARYLTTVLRCGRGHDLEILDGKGHSFRAKIVSLTRKEVVAEVTGTTRTNTESPLDLILIQGLLKGEKMDFVVQKTTELGIREIIPAVTERSQVKETRKTARWRKIALDAARQCGRSAVPILHEPALFEDLFSANSGHGPCVQKREGLLFWEEGGVALKEIRTRIGECASMVVAVGPEGGFTEAEAKLAESRGFFIASLGTRILRAETAAVTATAIIQFLFGDLGQGH
jgi:16S rRNA (uracil1498-N3)-methyltransferase